MDIYYRNNQTENIFTNQGMDNVLVLITQLTVFGITTSTFTRASIIVVWFITGCQQSLSDYRSMTLGHIDMLRTTAKMVWTSQRISHSLKTFVFISNMFPSYDDISVQYGCDGMLVIMNIYLIHKPHCLNIEQESLLFIYSQYS